MYFGHTKKVGFFAKNVRINSKPMDRIRHHMQSITLMGLAGILLVLAFYISQQTQTGEKKVSITLTPRVDYISLEDMPDCSDDLTIHEALLCYRTAEQVSEDLVLSVGDKLVQMETDTAQQMALIESQITWEESRNFECNMVRKMAGGGNEGTLQELICRTELNLSHLERLTHYQHEWYEAIDNKNKAETDN